jgi:hypothetical protein
MKPGLLKTSILMALGAVGIVAAGRALDFGPLAFGLSCIVVCLVLGLVFDPVLGRGWTFPVRRS